MATAMIGKRGAATSATVNPDAAGIVRRGLALAIDYAALLGLSVGLLALTERAAEASRLGSESSRMLGGSLVSALIVLYFAASEGSRRGASPGKLVVGVRVADVGGGPITFGRALIRTASKLASLLPFGVGFLMAAFAINHRALHDHLAGTVVLRSR